MKILIRCFLFSILLLFLKSGIAQAVSSCRIQVSIITCSPGDELYSLFGHSALRIVDSSKRTDIIYNWGTFDFDEPNFYVKFMRGKLLYFVSPDDLFTFLKVYQSEGRSVIEQVLKLTCSEKMKIKQDVDINMQGENRFYKYDFLFNNCTTRIRDFILNDVPGLQVTGKIVPEGTTFRNMIHSYLDKGGQLWSKLGIDILLGAKVDRAVSNEEAMFLPEYFEKALDSSRAQNSSLIKNREILIDEVSGHNITNRYETLILIGAVCIIIFVITILRYNWAVVATTFIDSFLLYATGVLGLLMLFMWFGTDHIMCSNNFNLLWALPTNFVAGFFVWKKPGWLKKYCLVASLITAILLMIWFWLPQELNISIAPLSLLLLNRYFRLSEFSIMRGG